LTRVRLRAPYLMLVGDERNRTYAKTGLGIVQWRRERVAGQLRLSPDAVSLGVPDMDVDAAAAAGVASLIVGVAPVGGVIPDAWWQVIVAAASAGLDVVSGLHCRLADRPEVAAAARQSGAALVDVRVPPVGIPVGSGRKRSGKRVLMVGTDCVVGKKYTALTLHRALQDAGVASTFRATGQTGIMIAGEGIPIDAVVADFVSGAAELLSPDNEPDHWDVIEGQGSLFHPGFAAVSLGLLHGAQPDAIVVCHDAARETVAGWSHYALPTIRDCMNANLQFGSRTNPGICCVGVSVNTSGLPEADRRSYLEALGDTVDVPCIDPLVDGCDTIARLMLRQVS
jgi:uncharacterized NAD-dependent epimerase/dehydratase family protein